MIPDAARFAVDTAIDEVRTRSFFTEYEYEVHGEVRTGPGDVVSPGDPGIKLRYGNLGILIQAHTRLPIFSIAKIKIASPRHTATHTGKPANHLATPRESCRECSGALLRCVNKPG